MDFKSAKELLALCRREDLPISEVMRRREVELGETTPGGGGPPHGPGAGDHGGVGRPAP